MNARTWERGTVFLSALLIGMEVGDELAFANGMTVRWRSGCFTVLDREGEHEAFVGNVGEAADAVVNHLTSLRSETKRRLP